MKEYVKSGGTAHMKYKTLRENLFIKFVQLRDAFIPIKRRDFVEMAFMEAKNLNITKFKVNENIRILSIFVVQASTSWIDKFEKEYNIVSRKITKIVGHKARIDAQKIDESITKFRSEVSPIIEITQPELIYNTDQMGINLELVSNRTLNIKGIF